jgi:fluoroquinolone transport system permease protein
MSGFYPDCFGGFMRILNALKADLRFQVKQGFYTVYIFITLFYLFVLHYLPDGITSEVIPILVFSDPSVVGFFFIGAIVMLEKTQGVLQYLVITPLRSKEYLTAKAISLAVLAITAGAAISGFAYPGRIHWALFLPSVLLTSVFFTLYGFIAAAGCKSMNQYLIRMVPYLLFIVLPCFSMFLPSSFNFLFDVFPCVAALKLIYGAFQPVAAAETLFCLIYLAGFDLLMIFAVNRVFTRKIIGEGESA